MVSRFWFVTLGIRRSSVEDLMDCLVLSEKVELRRCLRGLEISAKVDALPNGLWQIGDRFCCLPVLVAIGFGLVPGGLIVLSCWAILSKVAGT